MYVATSDRLRLCPYPAFTQVSRINQKLFINAAIHYVCQLQACECRVIITSYKHTIMNNVQRKVLTNYISQLEELNSQIQAIKDNIEEIKDAEQEKFDNLSEGLQAAENGQKLEQNAETLGEVVDNIDSAFSSIEDSISSLSDLINE